MRRFCKLNRVWTSILVLFFLAPAHAQSKPQSAFRAPENLRLRAAVSALSEDALLDPAAPAWRQMPARVVGLNRTPPLYDTDPPAKAEITRLEVRLARLGEKMLVRLAWRDSTDDSAALAQAPSTPYEQRDRKEQSEATNRFFDAAAVMVPAQAPDSPNPVSPSLQMGDPDHPVVIYYWSAARGAMRMEAHGRGTTRRTEQSFPARGVYRAGEWQLVLELPNAKTASPLAFAVWNGSQQDRDGRKYFSIWHWVE